MLVPPQIVTRPGENGSPAGACKFTNASHPDDGPYALVGGEYFSKGPIEDLARSLGLLVHQDAQRKYEALLAELAALQAANNAAVNDAAEARAVAADFEELNVWQGARIAELEHQLESQKNVAEIVTAYLAKPASRR